MEEKLPKRKPTRWQAYDYNSAGAYFITICVQDRRWILSRIGGTIDAPQAPEQQRTKPSIVGGDVLDAPPCIDPKIELLYHGKIADKYIRQLNDFYDNIKVNQYVIMPNHIHLMLFVFKNGSSRTSTPTANGVTRQHAWVSRFVSTFKRFCNKEFGENVWQRNFNDHVIRDRSDYEKHIKYISENPLCWPLDELYSNE